MKRRLLLTTAPAAGAWPAMAFGQAPMRRVAVLISAAETDPEGQARIGGLRQGLRELGWVEGRDIQLDVRFAAGDPRRLRDTVTQFVAAAPDLICVNSTPALDEVYKATKTIPVVFMLAVDPVGLGYIQSLARPGGNITGFTFWDATLIGKWLQLLKEVAPSVERATFIHNPANTPFYPQMIAAAASQPDLPKIALTLAAIAQASDIDRTIAGIPGGAVVVPSDPFNLNQRVAIAAAALKARLPLISIFGSYAAAGGLMTYGPDVVAVYRRSAGYIDRILKGANPADLPAQAPTKYEFLINMATARTLGLSVPPTLLATADEVIE